MKVAIASKPKTALWSSEYGTLKPHDVLFVEDISSPNRECAVDARRVCAMIAEQVVGWSVTGGKTDCSERVCLGSGVSIVTCFENHLIAPGHPINISRNPGLDRRV